MKKIPKKLHDQLLHLDAAILNEDIQQSLDVIEEINWTTYNLAALANLPHTQSVSVLRVLTSQDHRFRIDHPRRKNMFFEKVFSAALQKGFDPYAEECLWDLTNNLPCAHTKHIAKLLDSHPHANLQFSSFVAYVCSNYLVHPWLLKYTLSLPNAPQWLQHEKTLFDAIWNGEVCNRNDEKDVLLAHQYLLDNNAIITAEFLSRFQNVVANQSEYPDVQKQIEHMYQTTHNLYEKRLLNTATHNTGSAVAARKM